MPRRTWLSVAGLRIEVVKVRDMGTIRGGKSARDVGGRRRKEERSEPTILTTA